MRHVEREYFNASWELWRREIDHVLWDWAIDGPFCHDQNCGQRLFPDHHLQTSWHCIRCGRQVELPKYDLATLRDRAIRFFEEEARHAQI